MKVANVVLALCAVSATTGFSITFGKPTLFNVQTQTSRPPIAAEIAIATPGLNFGANAAHQAGNLAGNIAANMPIPIGQLAANFASNVAHMAGNIVQVTVPLVAASGK